ncbi:MAG: transporter substrate-binding domain-containing protein [Campylobacterales bacterium]
MRNLTLFFLLLVSITNTLYAEPSVKLSEAESEFVKNHPVIRVSNELDYPPFDFAINKKPMGYSIDMLNLILSKIGIKAEYINGYSWNELWNKFEKREIDIVHPVYHNSYRENFGLYSNPLFRGKNVYITRKDALPIKSIDDISDKIVAVSKGYAITEYLKDELPNAEFYEVENQREGIDAVARGLADVVIGSDAVASYIIKKDMQSNVSINGWFAEYDRERNNNYYYLIRRDWQVFHSLFLKAQEAVMISEIEELQKKWFGDIFIKDKSAQEYVYFSKEEKDYLAKKGSIKMCIDPDWMPFEAINESLQHIGMSAELLDIAQQRSGVRLELVPSSSWSQSLEYAKERKCDILSLAMQTPSRLEYMDFTEPYVSFPFVIATKNDKLFVENIESILDEKLSIVEGYAYAEILKNRYPNLEWVYVKNIDEGLRKVQDGEVYGYIGALATVAYNIQKDGLVDIKIAGRFDDSWDLAVGTRNDEPILKDIMQKTINSITEPEKRNIYNKWYSIKIESKPDYAFLWKIFGVIFVIIFLVIVWNINLRVKIKEAIKRYKKQEVILTQQSKMASMGELIGMIAHQWKQPLNAISLYVQEQNNMLDEEGYSKAEIKKTNKKILKQIEYMSDTINLFRNFFKPSNKIVSFDVCMIVKDVYMLMESKIKSLGVEFSIDCQSDCVLEGLPNDLKQVLLNIYSNALDVFIHRDTKNPSIKTIISKNDQSLVMSIQDSGGGIDEGLLPNKLFEKYTSTKGEGGTGIGLQMSKVIIEDRFGGKITATNIQNGAEFRIELPFVTKSNI